MRTAGVQDTDAVLAVLDDAAAWLAGRGVTQWPEVFRRDRVEPAVVAGRVWLAEVADAAVGTFRLDWSDPLWPDDGRAGYLHRFAVGRAYAGLGGTLLRAAGEEVRRRGRTRLRLDCGADNLRLRAYYEAAGFVHHGDVEFPGASGHGRVLLSRYERAA